MKLATKAVHAGLKPDEKTGAVAPPIYMTSTYAQQSPGKHKGYEYTRAGNPNFTIVEEQLAALEGGRDAVLFSSGLGALTALATTLAPGDSILALEGLYGGTYRLLSRIFEKMGIRFISLKGVDLNRIQEELMKKPSLLLFETPTNPLLEIHDIAALAKAAKMTGTTTIVDNTFATPWLQNPLALGADLVWHSCTKYLGGHSDIVSGAIISNDEAIHQELLFNRMAMGLNPSPFDAWLLSRSIKTLPLRMQKHESNASAIAHHLEGFPLVKKVYYPGLESHSGHSIAKSQMRGYGGMISIELVCGEEKTKQLISSFRYFTLAESLGCVESLVNHPATMTHASIPKQKRMEAGINDSLVRFSVGIEDLDDLIEDLNSVLKDER